MKCLTFLGISQNALLHGLPVTYIQPIGQKARESFTPPLPESFYCLDSSHLHLNPGCYHNTKTLQPFSIYTVACVCKHRRYLIQFDASSVAACLHSGFLRVMPMKRANGKEGHCAKRSSSRQQHVILNRTRIIALRAIRIQAGGYWTGVDSLKVLLTLKWKT